MSLSLISEFDDLLQPNVTAAADVDDGVTMSESALAVPERSDDTRADVPISETSERFLRALLAKVPIDRIEELYLFAPLRQGAVETGIAVIAARNEVASAAPAVVGDATQTEAPNSAAPTDSPYADGDAEHDAAEPLANDAHDSNEESFALSDDAFTHTEEPFELQSPARHTVFTARYRLVIKGPDRGKWEIDVVDEGDAPLLTVETVVRGVQRRAGEGTATVRYSALQLVRTLKLPTTGTP